MWFGLQYIMRYYLTQRVTMAMVDEAEAELTAHGVPFNRPMWEIIVNDYAGALPILIKALPEGVIVPQGTVLATIESLDERCPGLAAYVETLLLRVWFPVTIATRSMRWWRLINRYVEMTGTSDTTDFKVVDFGARGVSSTETAGIGGMAHLVNFQVTDNLMGIRFAKHAYCTAAMPGFSIPASEHSVTTSWGKRFTAAPERDGELEFFENALRVHGRKSNPAGGRYLVSIVIDTYDQDEALKLWGTVLKDRLIASNMCLVARPDSGDPIINVVHVLEQLARWFGHSMNDKGFKLLPECVRVIQGDGINEDTLRLILQRVTYHGWSVDNIVFGSGGGLLVHGVERDTHRFAMKASEVIVDQDVRAISKQPKTDMTKASKAGRFAVVLRPSEHDWCKDVAYTTIPLGELAKDEENFLSAVYQMGELTDEMRFEQVRDLAQRHRILPSPQERHALSAKALDIE